tara:strand:- start:8340 stop:8900 length:561 start_codon:yes stop_codon:yes gene_type:complete
MWAKVESNVVTELYPNPKPVVIGDVLYPKNIFTSWTEDELKAASIYPVIHDTRQYKDPTYYVNSDPVYAYKATITINGITHKKVVTKSYTGTVARPLADVKAQHKQYVNDQAKGMLLNTDWYALRALDGGTAMPDHIKNHRIAVRTKANEMCNLIDAATDVDALAALYVYNSDDPPIRPLGEFPII